MKIQELQKKPFKKWDIAVYLLLIIIAFVLFLITFYKPSNGGFEVLVENEIVLKYDYDSGKYRVLGDCVLVKDPQVFIINGYGGYNEITVDRSKKIVYVSDTDCGTTKECQKMGSRSVIICVPHKLVIRETTLDEGLKVG